MDTFNFLQKINDLHTKGISEAEVLEIYTEAEEIFEGFKEEINDLNSKNLSLSRKIDDVLEERDEFEDRIDELEGVQKYVLPPIHDNIVAKMIMDDLFGNLDRIPMNELEELVNKYKA